MINAISSMAETYVLINAVIRNVDLGVLRYMAEIRTSVLTTFFYVVTNFADLAVLILILLLAGIILKVTGYYKDIIPLIICVVGSIATSESLKLLFGRERPLGAVYFEPTFSFPSTHVTLALALYGFIALIILKRLKNRMLAISFATLLFMMVLLIGFSRIYLGVHYVSDAVGGLIVGTIWLLISMRVYKYVNRQVIQN